ncbi:MAG: MurR/RpiR family transcriptional regulator [Hyphomicrobiaceae bacterium]
MGHTRKNANGRGKPKAAPDPQASYEALRGEIARRHPRFASRLKQIAEFALDHPTEIALGTVAEVAERASVQPSAIVRFARALGFGGFTDMQRVFRSRLVASVAPSYKERIAGLRRDGRFYDRNPRAVLSRFASEGMVALESLQDSVHEPDLTRAIGLLSDAQMTYVLGLGGSFPVATHLTYVLRKLGRRVMLLDGLGSALADQAAVATPQDALIAISFKTYNPDTVRLFPLFLARGVPAISITDSLLSPIVEGADVVFEIPDMPEAALRTMVGPMCLVQSLAVGLTLALE